MALTAKQQQFLNNYVRKHSLKGKGKAKRAETFSLVREQVLRELKAEPWLLAENPGFRVRLADADALGEALKFDRGSAAFTQLLADMQLAVSARPQGTDPSLAQPGNPILRTKLRSDRDDIINAPGWNQLLVGPLGGDLKILRARVNGLLDRSVPTGAQLIEARGLVDELRVKSEFLNKRELEIAQRQKQLRKYRADIIGDANLYPDNALEPLLARAQNLIDKAAGQWSRADESAATSAYLDMMLLLADRDSVDHKNLKPGSTGEIVLAVRRKYKTGPTGQEDKNEANFKVVVKPLTNEIPVAGFESGGGASRELMGSVVGDKLQEMLGIELNVAKTRLVRVNGKQLGMPNDEEVTASVQAFVKGGKSGAEIAIEALDRKGVPPGKRFMQDFDDEAVAYFNQNVAEQEIQGKALFDLIALHADRHRGNFMVDDQNKLVPIDHGNILPSRAGLRARGPELMPPHAILGETQAAQKPFSPELVERIEKLDVNELVNTMSGAHAEIQAQTPDADKGDLEDGIRNARRSAEFLKFAARQLTIKQVYQAYGTRAEDIFFTDEDDKLLGFARAVASFSDDGSAAKTVRERYGNPRADKGRRALIEALRALGWCKWVDPDDMSGPFVDVLVGKYMPRVLQILDRAERAPRLATPGVVPPKPQEDGLTDEMWLGYLALGADAAAKRQGLDPSSPVAERAAYLDVALASIGKLP